MQQDTTAQMTDPEPPAYVTLLAVQSEVVTRERSEGKDASDSH